MLPRGEIGSRMPCKEVAFGDTFNCSVQSEQEEYFKENTIVGLWWDGGGVGLVG